MLNLSHNRIKGKVALENLYSLRTLKTPPFAKYLARWIMGLMGLVFLGLFIPWQQNIHGYGKVTAFTPSNRPQRVETVIGGRIESWKVREGEYVIAGDTIATISEVKEKYFDPELLDRLMEQIAAKESSLDAKKAKAMALERQVVALKEGMKFKLRQTENKVLQMNFKVTSDSTDYLAEMVNFEIAEKQFDRQQKLYDQGLKSLTELEGRRLKFQEAQAKLISVENKYLGSKNERVNAIIELSTLEAEFLDKISKAESDLGATRADIFETTGEISKLRNEYANMRIRNDQYHILAPQDGYIVQAQLAGLGETIKEGEPIVTIMPESPDIAVEMYVKAMDVPLLSKGRKVRIEFDGWPALQFSGWPNVAVGTFGGVISVIDYVNSTGGMFRILVTPDPEEDPWPTQLRLGSGVKGWAMLDEVPVWYEIWRQLNGFPPSLQQEPQPETKVAKK